MARSLPAGVIGVIEAVEAFKPARRRPEGVYAVVDSRGRRIGYVAAWGDGELSRSFARVANARAMLKRRPGAAVRNPARRGAAAAGSWVRLGRHRLLVDGAGTVRSVRHPPGEVERKCNVLAGARKWAGFDGRGRPARKLGDASLPDVVPDVLWQLGALHDVSYLSAKGDGKVRLYRHRFGRRRPALCVDGSDRLWIVGGAYRVEARGIVG